LNCPFNDNDLQNIQSDKPDVVFRANNEAESNRDSEKEKSQQSSEKTVNLFDILNNSINNIN